ncbi:MAG: pilus assembly protein [Phycisphaerae bacterium]|nr:pilus assembly protein [Phycisphaerae bacterium]
MLSRGTIRLPYMRCGTAMVEFVIALPFLAIVLGLTFFFGWVMMHKHQVLIANRYSAWQRVDTGAWPGEGSLNELAFNNRASSVSLSSENPVADTVNDLVTEAGNMSPRTEVLAEELVTEQYPPGRRAHVSADFNPRKALWQNVMRDMYDIHHRHGREGVTWRRGEASCWPVLRNQYYSELDESLERISSPADRMAEMIRGLYLAGW